MSSFDISINNNSDLNINFHRIITLPCEQVSFINLKRLSIVTLSSVEFLRIIDYFAKTLL